MNKRRDQEEGGRHVLVSENAGINSREVRERALSERGKGKFD